MTKGSPSFPSANARRRSADLVPAILASTWIFLLLILGTVSPLNAQPPYQETYQKPFFKGEYPQKIPLRFRAYPVYQGEGRFWVYVPVEMNQQLMQFLLDQERYTANVELEAHFKNSRSGKVVTQIWRTSLSVTDFRDTQDPRQYHHTMDSLELNPGGYEVLLKYRDLNGSRNLAFSQKLTLPEVEDLFAAPVLFFDPTVRTFQKKGLAPNHFPSALQAVWDFNRDLGLYWQVWRKDTLQNIPVSIELIDADAGTPVFAFDTTLSAPGHRLSLQKVVPATLLGEGKFRLKTVFYTARDSVRKILPFQIIWFDKPVSLWDEELAVQPLQYILSEAEYKALSSGSPEERRRKLREFWKTKDPTPQTPFNELEKEFYTRVDSTIKRFSTRRKLGWQTDPGKIYITNGPPQKVEDHSLDPIPRPYMRWIYYMDGKEIVYTFLAVDGRKEYELKDTIERSL